MIILQDYIRDVPNFPKDGILFKDITPILQNPQAFRAAINQLKQILRECEATKICAIEARGFMFGSVLAFELGLGFVPVRKKGKLPYLTYTEEYQLEYGTDALQIHIDAVEKNEKVVIIDDLLATGGTAEAVCRLLSRAGAKVEAVVFLVELLFLNGRERLADYNVKSVVQF